MTIHYVGTLLDGTKVCLHTRLSLELILASKRVLTIAFHNIALERSLIARGTASLLSLPRLALEPLLEGGMKVCCISYILLIP